jgi:hypothetical protein
VRRCSGGAPTRARKALVRSVQRMRARSRGSAEEGEEAGVGEGAGARGGAGAGARVGAGAGAGAAVMPGRHAKPTQVGTQAAPFLQSEGDVHPPQWPFKQRAKGHWMSRSLAQKKPIAGWAVGGAAAGAVGAGAGERVSTCAG